MRTSAGSLRYWFASACRLAERPSLWRTALRQVRRFTPRRWWRRPPFLPLPDRSYLRFRLETQYGGRRAPDPADLVTYLEWCRAETAQRDAAASASSGRRSRRRAA